ncbi:MAG: cardiolipin synthase [Myxococcales bacterium]|nr:cardiolipin synthase [Myxococcales bacterium]
MLPTLLLTGGLIVAAILAFGSAGHALLHKRDPRAQFSWGLTCLLLPIAGPLFYWSFGVNRVETRARQWQARGLFSQGRRLEEHQSSAAELRDSHPEMEEPMLTLLQLSRRVTGKPLLTHNKVELLHNGDEAYPAMIRAIEGAKSYVFLMSYIFIGDTAGEKVADALVRAGERGVDVRVLIDAIGGRVGRKPIRKLLEDKKGVRLEHFLPPSLGRRLFLLNLRNHRKILIVDGVKGFTGGINIGSDNVLESAPIHPIQDLHFSMQGPIVHTLEEVFTEDWCFRVGKDTWPKAPPVVAAGQALCRGIKDGPNEDFETLQWIFIGALSCSRTSVRILTPYFIPSRELTSALRAAVLRGVSVQIILPEKSNLPIVDWASSSMLSEMIAFGIEIYRQPSPFSHSKLLVVDDFYLNIGSANLDPRSLQLNFEFNVEVYDPDLAKQLGDHHREILSRSTAVSIESLQQRNLPVRLRDAAAKLLSPYL